MFVMFQERGLSGVEGNLGLPDVDAENAAAFHTQYNLGQYWCSSATFWSIALVRDFLPDCNCCSDAKYCCGWILSRFF